MLTMALKLRLPLKDKDYAVPAMVLVEQMLLPFKNVPGAEDKVW